MGVSKNLGLASLSAYLGAISFGYTIGYSSPALPDMESSGLTKNNPDLASWFGSLVTVGAMIGGPIGGWLLEKIGRKKTLIVSQFPFIVGYVLIYFGDHSSRSLLCGRFLTGTGSAIVMVVSPVYVAETATKELRGMLGSGVQLFITVGIFLSYLFGLYFSWKSLALIALIIPLMSLIIIPYVPDSPRYYLLSKSRTEAMRALQWLRGPHENVEDECNEIAESLPHPDDQVSWSDLTKAELIKPLRVSVGLMVFQQLSGINAVMFYTVSIFKSAGLGDKSTFATMIVGGMQVLATFVACLVMDKYGRRKLLVIAGTGMSLTCFTFGYYFYVTTGKAGENPLSWLPVFCLVMYIVSFSMGWGPIPMLVMSEIFPVKARGMAGAITAFSNWFTGFWVTKEFDLFQFLLGQHGIFCLFGILCVLGVIFVLKFVPETKGKSLEDIELYFLGRAIRGI